MHNLKSQHQDKTKKKQIDLPFSNITNSSAFKSSVGLAVKFRNSRARMTVLNYTTNVNKYRKNCKICVLKKKNIEEKKF